MVGMTHTYPTLYGHSAHGVVKVWNIRVESRDGVTADVVITHGQEDGKQQETRRTVKSGKNIGRANATTPWTQALAEAEAFWQKKTDKNYSITKSAATKKRQQTRLPMLALKYEDRSHTVDWNTAFCQAKFNGIRCLMERVGDDIIFHSRGNKQFTTLNHLKADALAVLRDGDMLDGELYNHGDVTFQELCSLVKGEKHGDPARVAKYVQFWNYDIADTDAPFIKRASRLVEHGSIKRVPTFRVRDEAEMLAYHQQFVEQGYEGLMLRSGNSGYKFQYRSTSLLKVKSFMDDEFEIVGAEEGVGKSAGQCTWICQTADGKRFGCRSKGSDELRREYWANRHEYIGKKYLTVKYQTLSDDGIPVFPVGINVRGEDYDC